MNNNSWFLWVVGIVVIAALVSIGWLVVRIDHVETMTVRSKDWYRVIKEQDDYYVPVTHTSQSCSGSGSSRVCTTRFYTTMQKMTRIINSWPSSGTYPDKPYWVEGYTIGPGHYERREESYVIRFSDDKQIYNFFC